MKVRIARERAECEGSRVDANAEIVRRFYERWSAGDLAAVREHMDDAIEYVNPDGAIEHGTRRGIAEFTQAVEKTLEAWEYWRAEPEELREDGDKVIAVLSYRTRGRGSGVEIEGRESALWTLRDGKVTRYQWFHGVDDAAAAAARG
jgi:ketosteroid isomerase-like protein